MHLGVETTSSPRPQRLQVSAARCAGWSHVCFLVIDTETTGVKVEQDRVVELGAVYFSQGRQREKRRMRINPECPIPKEASEIHGIYDEHVRGKPTFAEIAPRFLLHLDGVENDGSPPFLVGYNAGGFDVPILNAELRRAGIARQLDALEVLDLMIFVRWYHRNLRSRSLTSVCAHYGIDLHQAHSAAADAAATGSLLLRLVDDGLVPDGIEVALRRQRELAKKQDEEWRRYLYWLYEDRHTEELRMGAGRHCGRLLSDIDPSYFAYLLEKIPELPEEVRAVFRSRAGITS